MIKASTLLLAIFCSICLGLGEPMEKNENIEGELGELQYELAHYFKLPSYKKMENKQFRKLLDNLKIGNTSEKIFNTDWTMCGLCSILINQVKKRALTVKVFGEVLCNIYVTLSTWTISSFCADVIRIHLPILEYIVNNSKILDSDLACSILLQRKQCYYPNKELQWTITPPPEAYKKIPQYTPRPNAKPLKILHLSDIHLTPDYQIGGVSNCGYPTCCKKGLGNPVRGKTAGTWGDYNCDIPIWLFSNTLAQIKHTHKDIDFVYFTGDIVDHTVWQSSIEDNKNLIYFTFKTLYDTFPNTTVLPVIGNHETAPLNVFAPPDAGVEQAGLSTQWLYTLLSKLWRPWLSYNALRTVKRQGYYTHTINGKLKIIALNNNICYNYNWWLLLNTTFLAEQLDFLSSELEKSESSGQFVHIIMHVPGGNKECIEPWEANFNSLVRRFSHIIKGQFYGHTHTDELKIFYNEDKREPINVGYNGASLTPYVKFNPNYKIIFVDPNTYDVLDIDTYTFNLTEANAYPERTPMWYKLYSMKQAYDLDTLSPKNFDKLAGKIFRNDTLFNLYWRYYIRDGDASLKDGCDSICKKELICKIVTTQSMSPDKVECE